MTNLSSEPEFDPESVAKAARRLENYVKRTPLIRSESLSQAIGQKVYLKLENLQTSGSFKVRGAVNAILVNRDQARENGVITASAGNHAQGVAHGARIVGCKAEVIMPEPTPDNKILATQKLGAEVLLRGTNYDEAYEFARRRQQQSGTLFIHPYDQKEVIEGQGTLGVEITDQAPETLHWILVPVGGGGLISGLCLWFSAASPQTRIYPVQCAGGSSLKAALEQGQPVSVSPPDTLAEGIATGEIGRLPFRLIQRLCEEPFLIEDEEIVRAILFCSERERIITEGAGAAGVAALQQFHHQLPDGPGCVVISGGNIDMMELSYLLERGLRFTDRLIRIITELPDRPGALARFANLIGEAHGNIQFIHHERSDLSLAARRARVEVEISVRDRAHKDQLLRQLEQSGYSVQRGSTSRRTRKSRPHPDDPVTE